MRARAVALLAATLFIAAHDLAEHAWSGSHGEVIGAAGRIGSLLLRNGGGRLAATPRGVAPGGLSLAGTPIIVATPADALTSVLKATPKDRLEDLVLLSNGMVLENAAAAIGDAAAEKLTAGVLYFGVLKVGAAPTSGDGAPPSVVAGPHAEAVAALLDCSGLQCEVLPDLDALNSAAKRKMLWASAMWLICAARGCTVSEAHRGAVGDELRRLVAELHGEEDEAVMESLRAYSDSMPDVTPSEALALGELPQRNGWFLRQNFEQPLHEALLREVGVSLADAQGGGAETAADAGVVLPHNPSGLAFRAVAGPKPAVKSAVVVGAGIMGCAIALELARRGLAVTVLDQRPAPSEEDVPVGATHCEDATSGSWAWINANGKESISQDYAALNRLGMHMWRHQSPYSTVANWLDCGVERCDRQWRGWRVRGEGSAFDGRGA